MDRFWTYHAAHLTFSRIVKAEISNIFGGKEYWGDVFNIIETDNLIKFDDFNIFLEIEVM